jgi:hypothetical protein
MRRKQRLAAHVRQVGKHSHLVTEEQQRIAAKFEFLEMP